MERPISLESIETFYENIITTADNLSQFFLGHQNTRKLPRLYIYDEPASQLRQEHVVHTYPSQISDREMALFLTYLKQRAIIYSATYINSWNALYFKKKQSPENPDELKATLAEEITHYLFSGRYNDVDVDLKTISRFNGIHGEGSGSELASRAKGLTSKKIAFFTIEPLFSMSPDEFFSPIAIAKTMGDTYRRYTISGQELMELIEPLKSGDSKRNIARKRIKVFDGIRHLPEIAGNILLDAYNGNPDFLMTQHQDLRQIPQNRLMKQYIYPLLERGNI